MKKSELEAIKECCYKCKFYERGLELTGYVVPDALYIEERGRSFGNKADLLNHYPDIDPSACIHIPYYSNSNLFIGHCRKAPPRMPTGFPKIAPEQWCGSFKGVDHA